MLARARRFHRCVQREDVGLERNAVDHPDDVDDAARGGVDHRHGRDHFVHHGATARGHVCRAAGQFAGLACVGGGALHGVGQALHRHRRFLQRGRLLLGALGQVAVALGDLARAHRNGVGGELDLAKNAGHCLHQRVDALAQLGDRPALVGHVHMVGQVALFCRRHHFAGLRDGALGGLVLVHLGGDVGRVLHHLERAAVHVEDRVVRRLDPHLAPALAQPPVLAGVILAATELFPELPVFGTATVVGFDEQGMVLAADLVQRVAGGGQEVGIGRQDASVQAEFDDRLRLVDRRQLARRISGLQLLRGDVGGELHHLVRPPLAIQHRVVRGLDPDLAPTLAEAPVLAGVELATRQPRPELAVLGAAGMLGLDEQGMMLALDLVQAVAQRLQDVVIGLQDGAIQREFDDCLHAMQRGHLRGQLIQAAVLHGQLGGGAVAAQRAQQRAPRRKTGVWVGRCLLTRREAWHQHRGFLGVQ